MKRYTCSMIYPLHNFAFLLTPFSLFAAPSNSGANVAQIDPALELSKVVEISGLPRVLLIGDSISVGYTLPVRELLNGCANVHRTSENCQDTSFGLKHIDRWLGIEKWDVVLFNFGLHDLKFLDAGGNYTAPQTGTQVSSFLTYEENLRKLVKRLKVTGARLIFATTTPVPAGAFARREHDEIGYNEIAVKVMNETGVKMCDIHALVPPNDVSFQYPHDVHFTDKGYNALAKEVAKSIISELPPT